jgi:hypothetical protein
VPRGPNEVGRTDLPVFQVFCSSCPMLTEQSIMCAACDQPPSAGQRLVSVGFMRDYTVVSREGRPRPCRIAFKFNRHQCYYGDITEAQSRLSPPGRIIVPGSQLQMLEVFHGRIQYDNSEKAVYVLLCYPWLWNSTGQAMGQTCFLVQSFIYPFKMWLRPL